jgi:hypothetical protein
MLTVILMVAGSHLVVLHSDNSLQMFRLPQQGLLGRLGAFGQPPQ